MLDNHDSRIRFVDLLMEKNDLTDVQELPLPSGYRFVFYQPGDRDAWIAIEQSAKELHSFEQGVEVWQRYYGQSEPLLPGRMLFIENERGEKVATATAYPCDEEGLGQVHWVAVRREDQGRGLARPLIARVLCLMRALGDRRACLHTQTVTWVAVRLYLEFGFRPTAESTREHAQGWRIIRTLTEHPALAAWERVEWEDVVPPAALRGPRALPLDSAQGAEPLENPADGRG